MTAASVEPWSICAAPGAYADAAAALDHTVSPPGVAPMKVRPHARSVTGVTGGADVRMVAPSTWSWAGVPLAVARWPSRVRVVGRPV